MDRVESRALAEFWATELDWEAFLIGHDEVCEHDIGLPLGEVMGVVEQSTYDNLKAVLSSDLSFQ